MARWRGSDPADPLELLREAQPWWDVMPRGGSPAELDEWRAGFRAWCDQRGTNPLELLKLKRDVKLGLL
jgi:hypothetical protein